MNNFNKIRNKALLLVSAILFMSAGLFAQSPNSFKYQAVLRDLDGKVIANEDIQVEISILQGSEDGASVLKEVFDVTTNMYGLTNLEIGSINPSGFAAIDWGNGPYFIKVSVDGDVVGTSQLLSVPYALHAGTADNVNDADADSTNELQMLSISGNELSLSNGNTVTLTGIDFDGQYSSLTGAPTNLSEFNNDTGFITEPEDADADSLNEIQILSIDGNQITLSNGGTITLPEGFDGMYSSLTGAPTNLSDFTNDSGFISDADDADADPTNEMQILSIDGNKLMLSGGGFVILPEGFDGLYSSLTGVPTNLSDFNNDTGYLTDPADDDSDPSNELQNIVKTGNVVSLSLGGGAFVDSALTETQVDEMVSDNGYLTPGELGSMIYQDSNSVNIDGGEIDGAVIGFTTPEEGYFQNIGVNKNIYLPKTTIEEGVIYVDNKRFIHSQGIQNTYIGEEAGQLDGNGGNDNIGVGYKALSDNTSGHSNVAVGSSVMAENGIGTQNVAMGQEAMMKNTTGSYNTSLGAYSMKSNTDGSYNIGLGFESLYGNTQGSDNIAIGVRALKNNKIGNSNIAIGYDVLQANTTGEDNIGIGNSSLNKNTTGLRNVGTGSLTLNKNTTGNGNVANGYKALNSNTTGDNNVAVGEAALLSNTEARELTAVGFSSLHSNTTGLANTAVGARSLAANTEGYSNTATGNESLMGNTTGFRNTGMGLRSLFENTQGHHNTGIGTGALYDNTVGNYNAAMGSEALYNNVSGNYNTGVGFSALYENQEGTNNTAVGNRASNFNTGGDFNTAIGDSAMYNNRPGNYNTAIGKEALFMNRVSHTNVTVGAYSMYNQLTGEGNTGMGYTALYSNKLGDDNTALGDSALYLNENSRNTALGSKAMYNNTDGMGNTGVGSRILYNNKTGNTNAAIGDSAMYANTTGNRNTAMGAQALKSNNADENTAVGTQALYSNTSGAPNTAVGTMSLRSNSTGSNNAAVGDSALFANLAGNRNSAVGSQALRNNTASENTAIGTRALYSNTDGINNAAVGDNALYSNLTGARNAAVGSQALMNNTANDNTAIGSRSLYSNTTGTNNAAVGDSALYSNLTGDRNSAVGSQALKNNTASENTAIGTRALYSNTDGINNAAVGDNALYSNETGERNAAVGSQALMNNTADENTAVGARSMYNNIAGENNTAVGNQSLYSNIDGLQNSAFGNMALYSNVDGSQNSAVGNVSLYSNLSGLQNVAMGDSALFYNTTGISNTAVGYRSLRTNNTGNYNTAMGQNTLLLSTGNSNTALGDLAGSGLATGDGNVFLGFRAAEDTISGSNRLFINNDEADLDLKFLDNDPPLIKGSLIYGEFDNEYMRFDSDLDLNGKLRILNSSQSTAPDDGALTVVGGVGIGRRLNVGEEATFEAQVIIGPAAPSVDTMPMNSIPVSSNMLIVDGNASIGDGYIDVDAPVNGLLVEGNIGIGVSLPAFKMQIDGDIVPSTNGLFTLGAPSLGWDTLYMASTIDYQTDLDFVSGGTKWLSIGAANGNVSIGENLAPPSNLKLHVKGNGTFVGNHMALFENTGSAAGDGIAIKVNAGTPSNDNNYISFLNSSNQVVGRIEGETIADLEANEDYQNELALLELGIVATSIDVGIAAAEIAQAAVELTAASSSSTGCAGLGACVTAPIPSLIVSAGTNMALKIANGVSVGIQEANAIIGRDDFVNSRKEQIGVTYQSGAGDYAEWLPKANKNDKFWPGDIVGVKAGVVSRNTADAENVMVISTKPIVLGNAPGESLEHEYEKIAFMGQVPVKVYGVVNKGDYILPSGNNDGLGIAVDPGNMKSTDYKKIVGVAWSNSDMSGVNYVNVAVGLNNNDVAELVSKQEKKIKEQSTEIENLKARLDKIDAVLAKLDPEYGTGVPTATKSNLKSASVSFEQAPVEDDQRTILYYVVTEDQILEGLANAEEQLKAAGVDVESHPFFMKIHSDPAYKNKYVSDAIQTVEKIIEEFAKIDREAGEQVSIEKLN